MKNKKNYLIKHYNKNNNLKNEEIIIRYTYYSVHCLGLKILMQLAI